MLLTLPEDIKLCILGYLDVPDLLNLSSTCHTFNDIVSEKTVWLDALERVRLRRPIPLAYWEQSSRSASAAVPTKRLREAVIRAARIECSWSKPIVKPTRYERQTAVLAEEDRMQWVCHIGSCGIIVVYTVDRWCTCTFSPGGSARFQTKGMGVCYDFDVDSDGITVVFNSEGDKGEGLMEIYRVEFQDYSPRLVQCVATEQDARSNFLEDELVGCVLSIANCNYKMVIVDWRTGHTARIDTSIPYQAQDNITASATKDHVLIGCETKNSMQTWIYSLGSLRRCIAAAKAPEVPYVGTLVPQDSSAAFYPVTTAEFSNHLHSTSRGMWTGRQCCFTKYCRGSGQAASFKYTLLSEKYHTGVQFSPKNIGTSDDEQFPLSRAGGSGKSTFISEKPFLYNLPEESRLSAGTDQVFLHDIGLQGKGAVWVELLGDGQYVCRLATFNHEDDEELVPPSSMVSTLAWESEGFSWSNVHYLNLDDSAGVLTIFTGYEYWMLYFD